MGKLDKVDTDQPQTHPDAHFVKMESSVQALV